MIVDIDNALSVNHPRYPLPDGLSSVRETAQREVPAQNQTDAKTVIRRLD
jgi:hypothetical protein